MQSSLSEYFRVKKRLRDSDGSSGADAKKLKAVTSDSKLAGVAPKKKTSEAIPGSSKEELKEESSVKKPVAQPKAPITSEQMRLLLKNKAKLADLQAALGRFNNCSKQLEDFRKSVKDTNDKAILLAEQQKRNKIKCSPKKMPMLMHSPTRRVPKLLKPDGPVVPSPGITPDKFYSPTKNRNENIFSSPTKLSDIKSPGNSPFKPVAVRKLFSSGLVDSKAPSASADILAKSVSGDFPAQKR